MSINISVSGNSLKECHEKILALAEELSPQVKQTVETTKEFNNVVMSEKREVPVQEDKGQFNIQPEDAPAKRRRRGSSVVEQIEAEQKKVPPFGNMTKEQYEKHVAPPMPTTETIVKLPEEPNVLAQAEIPPQAPVTFAPPPQALPPNTHNYESFRNNLIVILNDLAAQGKINHQWINDQKSMFGGKELVQWHENQSACNQLFDAFVGWGLLNKI